LFPKLNHPLLDPDEGRQAEIPREMLAHHDLLLPRMAGQPYYEKPPLQYWLTAAVYSLFGVHSWCARMVPAAAAWLTVLLTFAWGQRTLGPRAAFLAAGGLCLTPGFVVLGRTVVLDSLLALCVAASWYAGYLAIHAPKLRWRWWLASAIACGLGLLAKGPIALVLFAPPVFAYQLLTSTAARPRWKPWLAFIGLALAIASPWYAAIALHDPDYLRQFIWRANVLRFVNPYDHEQPLWFYLPVLFVATLPWSFLWPALVYFLGGRSFRFAVLRTSALGYCMLAVSWSFLFLSLAGCKSPPYLAPLFAPLALLLGACIDAILFELQGRRDIYLDYVRQALPWRAVLFVLTVSAGSYVMISLLGWQTWGLAIVQAALSLALMIAWWRYGRHAPPRVAWAVCAVVTLLFVTFTMRDLLSGFASRHSPALIARLVRDLPGADSRTVVSYGRQWNSACFYLRRDVVCLCDQEHRDDLIKFLQKQAKTMVLVESGPPLVDFLAALPPTLGHEVHFPRKEGQAAVVVVRRQR
jgi:dolichol-phosphate mannosyltransferase